MKMFKQFPLSLLALAISSATLSQHAIAADDSKQATQLAVVHVNATRTEQVKEDVTRQIAVVSAEEISEIQPNSVAETVKYQANVSIEGGAVPGNQSINIRGLSGEKVLQVIDGARSNTNFSHRPSYFLDPELLSSVEVLKGPSSNLWGSGALGGVVVQNTITADDVIAAGKSVGGFVKAGYQDNGDVWNTTGTVAAKNDEFNGLFAATFRDSSEMEQGNGNTLYGTEAENSTILAKLGWNLDSHQTLNFQVRRANLEGVPPTVGSADDLINGSENLIQRDVTDTHIAIDYKISGTSPLLNLTTKAYYNKSENEETPLFGGTDQSDVETIGFNIINTFDLGKTSVMAGIDGYRDTVNTSRAENPDSSNRPEPPSEAESNVWGAFTNVTHIINEQWQVEAGLRYDHFDTESADLDSDYSESSWSPSAAIRWKATDWLRWTLRYDEAFRAPSSYELYIQGTHFNYGAPGWDNVFVANTDLKPEKSANIELTADLNFQNVFGKDQLSLFATVFKNDVDDFIYLNVVTEDDFGAPPSCNCITGTSTHLNATDAELKGFEVGADYSIGALSASLSYGQTHAKGNTVVGDQVTRDYLAGIPADKWVADVNYGFWDIDTKAGVRVMHVSEQDRVPAADAEATEYDGYTLADVYVSWEPSTFAQGLKIDLSLNNAFDQNYRVAWSEVYEPGRSVRLSAKYSF
ncbi:TonB-dependent hemoglobin/transferrin/lactoferrin family receptor [Echinimonas agarilytica]|uniref:TonB-dependent hemoglobin/transferrin/lactoferrin family receptor n=1 Tax=Echinimonas agarilytica TaxID=1215918 RepID=A0AA42B790_9GAMM|nr:TonB-dependent hemoglobin/transferrin/lactoferrin family receptor [Echinimonas agarilytica]MCM2679597.1 TonB-dependent hemoglobin/transferrin/lactoferrin family receptor [Echinimonas agarilytica]